MIGGGPPRRAVQAFLRGRPTPVCLASRWLATCCVFLLYFDVDGSSLLLFDFDVYYFNIHFHRFCDWLPDGVRTSVSLF